MRWSVCLCALLGAQGLSKDERAKKYKIEESRKKMKWNI